MSPCGRDRASKKKECVDWTCPSQGTDLPCKAKKEGCSDELRERDLARSCHVGRLSAERLLHAALFLGRECCVGEVLERRGEQADSSSAHRTDRVQSGWRGRCLLLRSEGLVCLPSFLLAIWGDRGVCAAPDARARIAPALGRGRGRTRRVLNRGRCCGPSDCCTDALLAVRTRSDSRRSEWGVVLLRPRPERVLRRSRDGGSCRLWVGGAPKVLLLRPGRKPRGRPKPMP